MNMIKILLLSTFLTTPVGPDKTWQMGMTEQSIITKFGNPDRINRMVGQYPPYMNGQYPPRITKNGKGQQSDNLNRQRNPNGYNWWVYNNHASPTFSALVGNRGMIGFQAEGTRGNFVLDRTKYTMGTTFGRVTSQLGKPNNFVFQNNGGITATYNNHPRLIFTFSDTGNDIVLTKVYCGNQIEAIPNEN